MTLHSPVTPLVHAKGTELSASQLDRLASVRVERGMGTIGRATLRFVDAGFALSASGTLAIGTAVKVSAGEGVLIDGVVTVVELEQPTATATPELVVTVDDKAARLASSTQTTTYLKASISTMISKLATRNGLTVSVDGEVKALQQEHVFQSGTDLAFLNSLTERSGSVWWVEPAGELKVVPAGKRSTSVSKELGTEVLSFAVRASSTAPDAVEVTGWDSAQQRTISTKVQVKDRVAASWQRSEFAKGAAGASDAGRGWQSVTRVADRTPMTEDEAKAVASGLADEAAAASVTMRATCLVDHRLAPGVEVEIKGMGPAVGKYLLTQVEHTYSRAGFHTRVTAGPIRPAGLVGLLGHRTVGSGETMEGLLPAVVTNVKPEDALVGMVKVKYTTVDGTAESAWARVLTLGAGPDRGMVFQPEVGDEVLVAFERGDTRRPVVLGGLYSKTNSFPKAKVLDDNVVKFRRITSRRGHTLEFADGDRDTEQHVMLTSKSGEHKIRLGNDQLEIEVGNVPVVIKNGAGAQLEFSDTGDVVIAGKNVTIKSEGAVKVEAMNEMALKATGALKAEGMTVDVKAQATGKVEAGATMAVKGAIVQIN